MTDLGEVTPAPYETIEWSGRPAARLRVGFRVAPAPLHRPTRARGRPRRAAPSVRPDDPGRLVEELLLAPDSLSREAVIRVYDHEVQGRTVVKPLHGRIASPSHGDAAVLQPRAESRRGLAVATAAQPWACREDPRAGAVWTAEEAARNLFAVGARPDAFSNCLNFGNPEDPRVLADFAAVTDGLAAGARALGFAVPSGNVSFYNGGLGAGIPPTPVLLATGIVDEIDRATTADLKAAGNALYLLGRSRPELGGSLWARRREEEGLRLPPVDPAGLKRLGDALLRAGSRDTVVAVHDVSDGGLAVALPEMAFGARLGFDVDLAAVGLPTAGAALAAEGGSRFVVEVPPSREATFRRAMAHLPCARIGRVTATGGVLRWGEEQLAALDLESLYGRWRASLALP